jgi:hypothetical protein
VEISTIQIFLLIWTVHQKSEMGGCDTTGGKSDCRESPLLFRPLYISSSASVSLSLSISLSLPLIPSKYLIIYINYFA